MYHFHASASALLNSGMTPFGLPNTIKKISWRQIWHTFVKIYQDSCHPLEWCGNANGISLKSHKQLYPAVGRGFSSAHNHSCSDDSWYKKTVIMLPLTLCIAAPDVSINQQIGKLQGNAVKYEKQFRSFNGRWSGIRWVAAGNGQHVRHFFI